MKKTYIIDTNVILHDFQCINKLKEVDIVIPFTVLEEVDKFKKQMDSIKADYTFKSYPDATHAFTNPKATELGKKWNMPIAYNAAADSASWNDMKTFFNGIFK